MIMTEQLYLFLQFSFLFLTSRFLVGERRPAYCYLATLTAFALALTKPAAAPLGWLFLGLAVVSSPRRFGHPVLCGLLYAGLLFGWSAADWRYLSQAGQIPPGVDVSGGRGRALFAETYFATWEENFRDYGPPRALIVREKGPASRALYEYLAAFLGANPHRWAPSHAADWFAAHTGNPGGLLDEMFRRPNREYFKLICAAVVEVLGRDEADRFFRAVAGEYGREGFRGYRAHLAPAVSSRLGGYSLFFQAHAGARYHGGYDVNFPFRLVREENGPATRQLSAAVRRFLAAYPDARARLAAQLTLPNEPGPGALTNLAFEHPGTHYFIRDVVLELFGPAAADRLLTDVAVEAFRAYPRATLLFWDNFLMIAAGPNDVVAGTAKRNVNLAGIPYLSSGVESLPDRMQPEVDGPEPDFRLFFPQYFCATLLKPVVLVTCLVLAPYLWRSPYRWFFGLLVLTVGVQYTLVSIFSQAQQRYSDVVYPLLLMLAAAGIYSAARGAGPARGVGPVPLAPVHPAESAARPGGRVAA